MGILSLTKDVDSSGNRMACDEHCFRLIDGEGEELLTVAWSHVVGVGQTYVPVVHGCRGGVLLCGAVNVETGQAYADVERAFLDWTSAAQIDAVRREAARRSTTTK